MTERLVCQPVRLVPASLSESHLRELRPRVIAGVVDVALVTERDRALEIRRRLLVAPDLPEREAEIRERPTHLEIVTTRLCELRRTLKRDDTIELLEALKLC
jgi:hypothetical protein